MGTVQGNEDFAKQAVGRNSSRVPGTTQGICDHINNHEVEGPGRDLPMRLQMLVDAKGDRIDK